jgi:IS5 family transposase
LRFNTTIGLDRHQQKRYRWRMLIDLTRKKERRKKRKIKQVKDFTQVYAKRAGIEGTISQGVRVMGLRRSRHIGLSKTHLQHLGEALAINLVRLVTWLNGSPLAPTRVSAFERLYKAA